MQTFREYNQNTHTHEVSSPLVCVNVNVNTECLYTGLKTNTMAKQVLNFPAEATASFGSLGDVFRTGVRVAASDILAK